ncbi:MAG TPA: hypothetical protein PLE40_00270 [Candidatus Pacearchaeota archaeon]|nr:hypothetical protein [Candidatus Pacearchaeota archaeon]
MTSNLEKYKKDIITLVREGNIILFRLKKIENLDSFRKNYEVWYSEALSLIRAVLPNRVDDFERYYYQKNEGCLKKCITHNFDEIFKNPVDDAILLFEGQLGIIKSAQKRFESSLFDIKQLVQADLFDSELDSARELNNKGFVRAAGALAGVVLERHLLDVCNNHKIKVAKKKPVLNDFNQLLKDNSVIEIPTWRFIQHLADLRNLCDHDKKQEPTKKEIEELINGVEKITKTIF